MSHWIIGSLVSNRLDAGESMNLRDKMSVVLAIANGIISLDARSICQTKNLSDDDLLSITSANINMK